MTGQKGNLERSALRIWLLEAQAGTMTVKSEVSQGSVFTVQIPAAEKPEVK
ncbi:MAG TPA: hypothetical protein VED24_03535 [Candidatus Acidoferrum sp.]|nr:hypothetical protein [Candidatus Acidoferrum sp.]